MNFPLNSLQKEWREGQREEQRRRREIRGGEAIAGGRVERVVRAVADTVLAGDAVGAALPLAVRFTGPRDDGDYTSLVFVNYDNLNATFLLRASVGEAE